MIYGGALARNGGKNDLDFAPKLERLSQGHTIDCSHLATDWNTRRRTAHGDPEWLEAPGDVEGGGLAFDRRIGREDHLLDIAGSASCLEAFDGEIVRPDAVKRRKMSEESVVKTAVFTRSFHRPGGGWFLDHQDDSMVATRVGAHGARVGLGEQAALRTELDRCVETGEDGGECLEFPWVNSQEMLGQSLGSTWPDPRQAFQVLEQTTDCLRP
jgi:hypothetical protein